MSGKSNWTAFAGARCIAAGTREVVARAIKQAQDHDGDVPIIIIDDATGRQVDFDLRGSPDEVVARLSEGADARFLSAPRVRGRPSLGVPAREVTLLPRHWEWLEQQPGGTSGALRRLVDEARASGPSRRRQAQTVVDRFMTVLAGNLPNYEDASRALYEGDVGRFRGLIADWPQDVRFHVIRLAADAFDNGGHDV
ncbi:DUF2239 family protein [Pseudochelatococcus sp. B33]